MGLKSSIRIQRLVPQQWISIIEPIWKTSSRLNPIFAQNELFLAPGKWNTLLDWKIDPITKIYFSGRGLWVVLDDFWYIFSLFRTSRSGFGRYRIIWVLVRNYSVITFCHHGCQFCANPNNGARVGFEGARWIIRIKTLRLFCIIN